MYLLAHVPAARSTLESVHQQLTDQGLSHASLVVPGRAEPVAFDLFLGLHVVDHGARQAHLKCLLCPPGSGHHLRYEFRVTTLDGEQIGPIGSSCVFARVLGEERGRQVGAHLTDQVGAHVRRTQTQTQADLLASAGNWREYLRAQGFDWVLPAMAGSGGLSADLREKLQRLQDAEKPLPLALLTELRVLTRTRSELPAPSAFTPSPAAFQPQVSPDARPRRTLRARAGAGNRMDHTEWEEYLRASRLTNLVGHWGAVQEHLDLPDDTRDFLLETIRGRRPFRLEDLTLLQTLTRSEAVLERLRDLGPPERLRPAVRAARIERVIEPESGLELLDVRGDPHVQGARAWLWGLKAVFSAAQWRRVEAGVNTGALRADDYAALRQTLLALPDQGEPGVPRTARQFLTYVALLLGREKRVERARELLHQRRQATSLIVLDGLWQRYRDGKPIQESELIGRALNGTRRDAPAPTPPAARPGRKAAAVNAAPAGTAQAKAAPGKGGKPAPAQLKQVQPKQAQSKQAPGASPKKPPKQPNAQTPPPAPVTPGTDLPNADPLRTDPLSAERPELQDGWGRGLSSLVPPRHRRAVSRAVHQPPGKLDPEQVRAARHALDVYRRATRAASPPRKVFTDRSDPRTPAAYAAALARMFTDLGVPHLRDPLAARGPEWLLATFPAPYRHYERTGELHRDLSAILNALT
ncbi:hypothetical protein GCM10008959_22560 [Deinococcus seoulensis]|uniref:Uncharacterized protein n=1 Tax=Deinococcus seoulensis TaxID=1837379 RepID=A0ABQ2RV87_9DEIO|nr:hypothetical protein [Deinococcus seoulensis]GGR60225.1 hypothetical protein GCM10008959_22560 [Deinococcus seoulensis]